MLPGEESRLPPGFDEIQRQELSRLYGRMSAVRLVFVPVLLAVAVYLALAEPARWRAVFVFAVVLPLAVFFVVESLRFRRAGLSRAAVPVNLAAVVVGQSALAFATGGLESPVTYAFVPLAVMIASSPTLNLMFYPLLIATQSVPDQVATYNAILAQFAHGAGTLFFDQIVTAFAEHLAQLQMKPLAREAVERAREALEVQPGTQFAMDVDKLLGRMQD